MVRTPAECSADQGTHYVVGGALRARHSGRGRVVRRTLIVIIFALTQAASGRLTRRACSGGWGVSAAPPLPGHARPAGRGPAPACAGSASAAAGPAAPRPGAH